MTQKLDDDPDLKRVSMVWPAHLKEQVRELVGSRGLTNFTVDAVREKLGRLGGDGELRVDPPGDSRAVLAEPSPPAPPTAEQPGPQPEPAALSVAPNQVPAPVEVMSNLPLPERMARARLLVKEREGGDTKATADQCPTCLDELVNGECWTCGS